MFFHLQLFAYHLHHKLQNRAVGYARDFMAAKKTWPEFVIKFKAITNQFNTNWFKVAFGTNCFFML